ncbi:MAG: hypothetical protein RL724_186, partial [Pseudomonadota bacterium]
QGDLGEVFYAILPSIVSGVSAYGTKLAI